MRYALIAAGLLLSHAALADGNGLVTGIQSANPLHPNCLKFFTNNGPTAYGVSTNEPTFEAIKDHLTISRFASFPIAFVVGTSDAYSGDCGVPYATQILF
jgi:hypothetical protein